MICERSLKNKILISIRKAGVIKKKKFMRPMKVRTINSSPTVRSIESEQHVYILNKLSFKKNCQFDPETRSCKCGAGLEEFLIKKCN
jgi:hypothetical protein